MTSTTGEAWRYYAQCYRSAWLLLLVLALAGPLQIALLWPVLYLVGYMFDRIIPAGDLRALVLCGAGILGLSFAGAALAFLVSSKGIALTKNVTCGIRGELLDRLFSFSRDFLGKTDHGRLHASIIQDTERVDYMGTTLISQVFPAVMLGAGLLAALLYLDWVLVLVLAAVAPLAFFANRHLSQPIRRRSNELRSSFANFSQGVLFVLRTMDLARLQTAETLERERQRARLEELRKVSGSVERLHLIYSLAQGSLFLTGVMVILVVGGYAVSARAMSVGELVSFFVAVRMLNQQAQAILGAVPILVMGQESLRDLCGLMQHPDRNPYSGRGKVAFNGEVRLESVSFAYNDDAPFLRGLDLTIEPESIVAIVGPNGSGKTTVLHLICGFYRPQHGRVLAQGVPYDEIDMTHLRRSIGVVLQNPTLFPGTILENLTYGYPDASMDQVREAARIATAAQFIEQFDDGYETQVGERGTMLSGGQRQRIALARAILRSPRLLLLDEPTSSLDVEAVGQLLRNLADLRPRPTTLLISHDSDVIQLADKVFELCNGRLVSSSGGVGELRRPQSSDTGPAEARRG